MRVPMCEYDTHEFQYQHCTGRWVQEAIAKIKPCGCAGQHTYEVFDERLRNEYPHLHLGFDRVNDRWVIYRWSHQIEPVKLGEGLPTVRYNQRYLDIVIDCKWAIATATKERGRRVRYEPRMYGDWVLRELRKSDPRRSTPDQGWVADHLNAVVEEAEANKEKKIAANAEAWVHDAMTLADRGNPYFLRKQFRQRKTLKEVVTHDAG